MVPGCVPGQAGAEGFGRVLGHIYAEGGVFVIEGEAGQDLAFSGAGNVPPEQS